jgi:hypothetical protein
MPLAVDQKLMGFSAMQRGVALMKPHYWLCLGYTLLVSLMCAVPLVLGALASALIPSLQNWLIQTSVTTLLGLPTLFLSTFIFVLYKALLAQAKMRE